ncbi:response regulator transcription factor [Jeotgalibacillus sp. S-D1]|uniref:LytR/AlgR family response regulator transcription factor n=1 Tax=Jeotgalibacillus sp. S-D1 TaxID=2552189 RepID=UPI00105A76A3|nr:LytTR family DNA-binding domain-containing protein [Jeotgalibacillus sp. S-D1]TDL31135.1 response regulator transcription factor [Jeotgalibacillus sp. S-D1]
MRLLIAEDDLTSRKLIKNLIDRFTDYKIVAEATNGEELIKMVIREKPDVTLVDIGLPLLNGMDAIKSCKEIIPDLHVIFITGNDEYAIEAFNINAADYIIKPIQVPRLLKSLERVKNSNLSDCNKKKDIMIKHNNSYIFIPKGEIMFIVRKERKSVIHSKKGQYETNEPLSNLEKKLDQRFLTSHRSNIINMDLLDKIEAVGHMYIACFKNYKEKAKITKSKFHFVQLYKASK